MKISVVIPTLNNRADYLCQAVNSVINQTVKPAEIIIVNNGRGSVNTCKFEQNNDIKITSFDTVYRAGSSQARNFGGSLAIGDYVSFLDDDDYWHKDYLQFISNKIESDFPDCLVGSLNKYENCEEIKFKSPDNNLNIKTLLVRNPSCTGSTVTVKKDSFLKIKGYNPVLVTGQDKALVIDFLLNQYKVVPVPDAISVIREHTGSRNTDHGKMVKGLKIFYSTYRNQMSIKAKIINKLKVSVLLLKNSNNRALKLLSTVPVKIKNKMLRGYITLK